MLSSKVTDTNKLYWDYISAGKTLDNDMVELFLARVAAFSRIGSADVKEAKIAKDFLLETMSQSEDEYGFSEKLNLVKNLSSFSSPNILAKRCDGDLYAIVYKIDYQNGDVSGILHEISFFTRVDDNKYKFTHKFDLAALYQQFCRANDTETKIRQLGDVVLHHEAKAVINFSESSREIEEQIDVLKRTLTKTGGVGIAANQCSEIAEPLKIILSGVDYNEPEHVIKAITRYPTALFPQMITCINPVIVGMDVKSDDFAEGCLSVHGIFRGVVRRPKSVTVSYQDASGSVCKASLSGTDARVMLHELDHILNGKVYIQRIIEELTLGQCQQLVDVIGSIKCIADLPKHTNPFLTPTLIFERDADGKITFDLVKVKTCFQDSRKDVLDSIYNILNERITTHFNSTSFVK